MNTNSFLFTICVLVLSQTSSASLLSRRLINPHLKKIAGSTNKFTFAPLTQINPQLSVSGQIQPKQNSNPDFKPYDHVQFPNDTDGKKAQNGVMTNIIRNSLNQNFKANIQDTSEFEFFSDFDDAKIVQIEEPADDVKVENIYSENDKSSKIAGVDEVYEKKKTLKIDNVKDIMKAPGKSLVQGEVTFNKEKSEVKAQREAKKNVGKKEANNGK